VTLSLRPAERALFATQPLQVAVVNLDSGLGSGSITVTHPGTTPPQAPPPVIVNAGTGCADNYCLWVVGQQLEPSIAVELVDPTSNALLATYSGADLNYDLGAQTVTLALKQGSAERQRLTAGPLGVRVLNMASGLRSGMAQVSRP
jgi:hypothetical protein